MHEMKALDALLGLGILGSLFDTNGVKPPDIEKFKAQAEAKRAEARKNATDFMLRDADRQAKAAKALYDAFIAQGFSDTQALELTKTTLENN